MAVGLRDTDGSKIPIDSGAAAKLTGKLKYQVITWQLLKLGKLRQEDQQFRSSLATQWS